MLGIMLIRDFERACGESVIVLSGRVQQD